MSKQTKRVGFRAEQTVRALRMKIKRYLLALALTCVAVVNAATIETPLLSVQVPDRWRIEDNKSSVILVTGNTIRDRTPMPFLTIQYCLFSEPPVGSDMVRCDEPCSEKSLKFPTEQKSRGTKFATIVKSTNASGTVEYSTGATDSRLGLEMFALVSCGKAGQVYVGFVSDQEKKEAKSTFGSVVKSIKWKL
jgi:hypothetical protein